MRLRVVRSVRALRSKIAAFRRNGATIGFVPTMGALHRGHLALVERAKRDCDRVVVSVFVNPLQFGPREDYRSYPRPFSHDKRLLEAAHVDLLFHPAVQALYPQGSETIVDVPHLGKWLCGVSRPQLFKGAATVVLKLLNVVMPDLLYLGQKDYQQQLILRRMICDLHLPIRVKTLPTVREPDGLAMSSRNAYLNAAERSAATVLWRVLGAAKQQIGEGEKRVSVLKKCLLQLIAQEPLARLDYLSFCHPETLMPVQVVHGSTLLALAVYIGKARLIDNMLLKR